MTNSVTIHPNLKPDYLKGALLTSCIGCTPAPKRSITQQINSKIWPNPNPVGPFLPCRVYNCETHYLINPKMAQHAYRTSWAVFAPARARSHLLGLGTNCSPHTGHSIRSKSMRRTSAGGINLPHFGHFASSDACTFLRLIFLERGATGMLSPPKITDHRPFPYSCHRLYLAGAIYAFQVRIYCVGEVVQGESC
jgi:hypothetical protein